VNPVNSISPPAALAPTAQGLKTVIMLAYYFPPDNISGARRPFRFAKYLPGAGYGVAVISAAPPLEGWANVYTAPAADRPRAARIASAALSALQTHLLPYNDRLPWIADAVSVAGATLAHTPACAVLSTSPPISTHLAALCIKRRFGLPWVADFRDPLYGNPFRTRKLAWTYDLAVERLIVSQADAVIANTDAAADVLQRRYPRWRNKVHLLWNGYDPEERVEARPIPERPYHLMTHAGSIYGGRRPDALLKALTYLIDAGRLLPDQFRLQLIGPLELDADRLRPSPFERLVAAGCLTYTGTSVSEADAREAMSISDSLLLLDTNSQNSALQLPAKIFDYIRIGRRVLAFTTRNSPTERVLADSGIRYVAAYPDDSAAQVAAKILDCIQLPSHALAPSGWFRDTFAAPAQAAALAGILNRVAV
jgi:hypothetical protein